MPPLRKIVRALFGAVATITIVLASGAHAHAEPDPTAIEQQIDQQWNALEPIIEQYNQVHSQLKDGQAKQAALQRQLMPLELQIDNAMARVGDLAAHYYRSGAGMMVTAVVSGDDADDFVEKLTLVNQIAHIQRTRIGAVAAARDRFAADKKVLDDLVKQLAAQDADLAAKRKDIEAKLASLQKLRQQAYGTGGTGTLKPVACPFEYLSGKGGTAASKACGLIGRPYEYGAAGPSTYDCSGLTMVAWAAAGVSLAHQSQTQWRTAKVITAAERRPGDLVFFYSDLHHVGIYVGGGWMVHAPTTGDFVRMAKIEGRPLMGYRRPA